MTPWDWVWILAGVLTIIDAGGRFVSGQPGIAAILLMPALTGLLSIAFAVSRRRALQALDIELERLLRQMEDHKRSHG